MDEPRRKVLVIDDDKEMLDTLGELVTAWGYLPVLASGSEEAIRIFNEDSEIQLIVSDQEMAPWNGIAVIRFLKGTTERRFEAIIFSGGHLSLLVPQAADAGVRKVVSKQDYRWLQEELVGAKIVLDRNL